MGIRTPVNADAREVLGATDPDRSRDLVGGARLAMKPPEGEA
jgi:hypothetical protein